jgi:hypothetical protein
MSRVSDSVSIGLPNSFFVMRARFQSHCKKNQALIYIKKVLEKRRVSYSFNLFEPGFPPQRVGVGSVGLLAVPNHVFKIAISAR